MKNWPFRYQIILISAIPALLVWLILTTSNLYLTWGALNQIHQQHGETLVRQLAPSCEFAIFSGDLEPLGQLLENVVATTNVDWIEVFDTEFHLLTRAGRASMSTDDSEGKIFSAPIHSTALDIDEITNNSGEAPPALGVISIHFSTKPIQQLQHDLLVRSFWIGSAILLLIVVLATTISKKLAAVFQKIRSAMRRIASGDFTVTEEGLPEQGELGELAGDLHKMAQSLERNRKHALAAYEQLEIKSRENEQLLQEGRSEP